MLLYVRILPAFMLFLATFVNYFTRVSINIAIITMTKDAKDLCADNATRVTSNSTGHEIFCWSPTEVSNVKGAFYFGYIFLQVPGGRMSELYGTKRVLGISTMICGVLMLMSPAAATMNVWLLILLRALIGLAQGVLFPSINPMLVRWARKEEHAKFGAFASMGGTFGTVFIYPLCGIILQHYNWKAVFYISGMISFAWCLFWFILITDDPADNRFLPQKEKDLILRDRTYIPHSPLNRTKTPFKQILSSIPVISLIVCNFANDWGLYMLLTEGPNFLSNVLKKDIETIGFLSSMPYLGRFMCAQLSGSLADYIITNKSHLISTLNVRKIMFTIAFISPALALSLMGFLTVHWYFCIAVMTIGFSLNGFNVPAFLNIIDIAPSYSGTVTGFTNGISSVAGTIVPLIAGHVTASDPSNPDNWKIVFFSGVILYLIALTGFYKFAKDKPEPFNDLNRIGASKRNREEDEEQMETFLSRSSVL